LIGKPLQVEREETSTAAFHLPKGDIMYWPYIWLILAIVSASLASAGVRPVSGFTTSAVVCSGLFAVTGFRVFRKYRL
jgi:hypothetical protein